MDLLQYLQDKLKVEFGVTKITPTYERQIYDLIVKYFSKQYPLITLTADEIVVTSHESGTLSIELSQRLRNVLLSSKEP